MNFSNDIKAKIIDTMITGEDVDSFDIVSVLDLIKLCINRYDEYEKYNTYLKEAIDNDENIKNIFYNYRTKYLGGCLFEVAMENKESDKYNSFLVFYKDGKVSYYPGVADIKFSLEELKEIKNKFFNDSKYVDLFKGVGEYILKYCSRYSFTNMSNEYKIDVSIDKIKLSISKHSKLDNNKYLDVIYLFDDKDIDELYGETLFKLGNYIYKYVLYGGSKTKKLRIVNTDIGKFYIGTNISGIEKMLGNSLNRTIFDDGNDIGVKRFLNNIYVDKKDLPESILECDNCKKRVRRKNGN